MLVLENGQIVEQGTPDAVIQQNGRFAALLELEAAGWDWQVDAPGSAGRQSIHAAGVLRCPGSVSPQNAQYRLPSG